MGCNRLLAMEVSQARVQQIGQASNGQAYPELQLVSTGPELFITHLLSTADCDESGLLTVGAAGLNAFFPLRKCQKADIIHSFPTIIIHNIITIGGVQHI